MNSVTCRLCEGLCPYDMPDFLKRLWGLVETLSDYIYDDMCTTKRNKGCSFTIDKLAKYLGWSIDFTRKSMGILYKLCYVDYIDGKFYTKHY